MGGSRGGTGGPDPPPEKSQKIRISKQYWSRSPENSQSYQASIQCWAIIGPPASDITFWIGEWLYIKELYFRKDIHKRLSISTPVTLRMQKASSRFFLHNFPWWVPLSIDKTWDLWLHRNEARAYCRTTTAKPFSIHASYKVEWALGEPKNLGLNWNRQNLYIRNGMNCNYTCPRCS